MAAAEGATKGFRVVLVAVSVRNVSSLDIKVKCLRPPSLDLLCPLWARTAAATLYSHEISIM